MNPPEPLQFVESLPKLLVKISMQDEITAFNIAAETAGQRGWPWLPPFAMSLEDWCWQVSAEPELRVSVAVDSGTATAELGGLDGALDPLEALTQAGRFAAEHGMPWKPMFTLECNATHWVVGACQAQLGGQVHIHVGHDGQVRHSSVNPK